ncbi:MULTISPECIES: hypothetical protein [unclassified Marinobacter]|uniref:hypothetical protein n=1 Tax=unclassified Marinobacter TaxID=83889 RepID=UPI000C005E03|nr:MULTISPECIES: hypothetical protein [unclassified Marinobacter]PFG52567.1 hypothetical protein ATG98_1603 [Marinobacter sp. LV10R520-4]
MKTGQKRDHSPSAPVFSDLQGARRSQGYGKILLIESDQYTLFEETTISCQKLCTGAIAELIHYYEDLVVEWGRLNDAVGYLNIRAMAGQSCKTGRPAADLSVVDSVMQKVLADIGEPTQGILSDTLERHLPNGWHLTLSNEIYRAYDGQLYEDVSIPVALTSAPSRTTKQLFSCCAGFGRRSLLRAPLR